MIQICMCNRQFTSPLVIPDGQGGLKSCRTCGCFQSEKMWGSVESEFSCAIDPQLKWKTSSNGKHRALRRARNFMQGKNNNGNKFIYKNSSSIKDLSDELSKKEEDLLVAESEKFGVSVLGRRFNDNLESVPIKKRRFSLLHSHSAPHLFPSSDFHDQNHGGHLTLFQNNQLSCMQDESGIYHSHVAGGWGEEKCFTNEKRSSDDIDELKDDSIDFSGISILAAAACSSSLERGFTDSESPTNTLHSLEEKPPLLLVSDSLKSQDEPSPREPRKNKTKSSVASTSGETRGVEPDQMKFDEYKTDSSLSSLQNFSSKRELASFHDDRLHWDLNTVMDIWEGQSEDLPSETHGTEFVSRAGLAITDNENSSHCFDEVARKHIGNVSQVQASESLQDELRLEGAEVIVENTLEKTEGNGENSCSVKANARFSEVNTDVDRELSTNIVSASKEDGYDLDSALFPEATIGIATLVQSRDSVHEKCLCKDTCTDNSGECPEECRSLSIEVAADINSQKSQDGRAFDKVNQPAALINSMRIADKEQLFSSNVCVDQFEECFTDSKVDGSKSCTSGTEKCNSSASLQLNTSPNLANSMPEGVILDRNVIPPADNRFFSYVKGVRWSAKDSPKEHFDSEEHSDACPSNTDFDTGLEKVEFLGDDDSQYEDGEVRETILNSWGEDGAEEVETEHVDYGSDCREADFFEAESNCSHSDLVIGTKDFKNEYNMVSSSIDGNRLPATDDDYASSDFQKCYATKDVLNPSGCVEDATLNLVVKAVAELPTADKTLLISKKSINTDNDSGKSSQPERSRIKASGWDKLPRREDASVNSFWNHGVSVATCNSDHPRKLTVCSVKRDSPKVFEASYRKDVSYAMENRKHDHIDLNAGRNTDSRRSIGRNRLPNHGRIRADSWMDLSDHRGVYLFDSSEYCLPPNFETPGSKNATAAAVAKVESNGFVVEPDGTIVKAGCIGSTPHLSGHPSNSSSTHNTRKGQTIEVDEAFTISSEACSFNREVSPGRCFNSARGRGCRPRHDPGPISFGPRNRHHAPMFDRRMDSVSLQQFSSRKQQTFSPQRRPIHRSTRSPSRSKSRSPNSWVNPRGRDGGRINGGPGERRQSRSPLNYRSLRRMPRQRSPLHSAFPAEEFPAYDSSLRNHSSPRHASRWLHNERFLQGHFREHQPRISAWRNSRLNSHGRVKPCEYYQPSRSERFHEDPDCGRGSMLGSRDVDLRGKSNRYQTIHSEEHLECNGNGLRGHSVQSKSLGFQSEGSPRRIKEMAHFRHGRDRKMSTDFKSDDRPFQRRT